MTEQPQPREAIVIKVPVGAVAAVPSLLGFEPERSFVIVWVAAGRRALTMRVDRDDARVHEVASTAVMGAHRVGARGDEHERAQPAAECRTRPLA
mgnify:FL=1